MFLMFVSRKDASSMSWLRPRSRAARRRGRGRRKRRIWTSWRRKWTWWVSQLQELFLSLSTVSIVFLLPPLPPCTPFYHPKNYYLKKIQDLKVLECHNLRPVVNEEGIKVRFLDPYIEFNSLKFNFASLKNRWYIEFVFPQSLLPSSCHFTLLFPQFIAHLPSSSCSSSYLFSFHPSLLFLPPPPPLCLLLAPHPFTLLSSNCECLLRHCRSST